MPYKGSFAGRAAPELSRWAGSPKGGIYRGRAPALVKTGGRLVKHARYRWLLLAESHLARCARHGRLATVLDRVYTGGVVDGQEPSFWLIAESGCAPWS